MRKFWLVWNETPGLPACKHKTRADAVREAERLALNSRGEKFHVLEVISTVEVNDLVHTVYDQNDDGF